MTISSSARNKLILFVKAPVPGQVKTRLTPALTPEQACGLYRSWACDIYRRSSEWGGAQIEVAYAPHPSFPTPDWVSAEASVASFEQEGKTLGEKLIRAFSSGFSRGADRVVIIGSDSPGLPVDYLEQAFEGLSAKPVALGPADDGGYYLIGLQGRLRPELFQDIAWSTDSVFSQTMDRASRFGLSVHLLPGYFDIDTPEDLRKLPEAYR
jgi:rSAM/selenodomain-associated transferase 1